MFLEIFLYFLRVLNPLIAVFIIYQCFTSMRKKLRPERPLVMLVNKVNRDIIPVMYWENSIGRSRNSDIILTDRTISRDHAVLYRRDEGWFIGDTGSKSGVLVNNEKIDYPTALNIGDNITLGVTTLVFQKTQDFIKHKESWFFNNDKVKLTLKPTVLLFLVSFFHFLLAFEFSIVDKKLDIFLPLILLTVVGWGFFLVTRLFFNRKNFELETLGFFLSGSGILLIGGASLKDTYVQILAMGIGMALFIFMIWFMREPEFVMRWRVRISIFAIGLLALNLLIGSTFNGSKNWIIIGPVSIQPSEFVKIALILVGTSALLQLQTVKNLTEFIGFSALCIGALFLMSDFGTACIFFLTFLIIAFIRSGDLRTIIFILTAAFLGAFLILKFKPYIADRFSVWGHAWEYVSSSGYQQAHVMAYSASGGLFGLGLGRGNLKYIFAADSDLVFGMMCEELGLIFAILVCICIAGLAFYAKAVSSTSRSTLYSIAAYSAAGMLVFQSILNVFGATDLLPLTGVTLPFISLGGSSMISVWGLLAFIKAADERTYSLRD